MKDQMMASSVELGDVLYEATFRTIPSSSIVKAVGGCGLGECWLKRKLWLRFYEVGVIVVEKINVSYHCNAIHRKLTSQVFLQRRLIKDVRGDYAFK